MKTPIPSNSSPFDYLKLANAAYLRGEPQIARIYMGLYMWRAGR